MNKKIWGWKLDLFNTSKLDIDILFLIPKSFCSYHQHKHKNNLFIVLWGEVIIHGDYYRIFDILIPFKKSIVPKKKWHRFIVWKPSIMIEIAYTKNNKLDQQDIIRLYQGGRIIDNNWYTEDELKEV